MGAPTLLHSADRMTRDLAVWDPRLGGGRDRRVGLAAREGRDHAICRFSCGDERTGVLVVGTDRDRDPVRGDRRDQGCDERRVDELIGADDEDRRGPPGPPRRELRALGLDDQDPLGTQPARDLHGAVANA